MEIIFFSTSNNSRKILLGQIEDRYQLSSKTLCSLESFRVQDNFSDKIVVWFGHSHWSEQLFQIVRKFGATSVPFTSWIQCNKDPRVVVNINLAKEKNIQLIEENNQLITLKLIKTNSDSYLLAST